MRYPENENETPCGKWSLLEITIALTIVFTLGFMIYNAFEDFKKNQKPAGKIEKVNK